MLTKRTNKLLNAGKWARWLMGTLFLITACSDNDDPKPDPPVDTIDELNLPSGISASLVEINGEPYANISGGFNESYEMTNDIKWILSGGVTVESGATLTIEKGTEIFAADVSTPTFISVLRGAKIHAEGTASEPIVLSSIVKITEPNRIGRGLWGGIILNGNATTNAGANVEGEGGSGLYGDGGSPSEAKQTESSGTLKYVRVEYAGRLLTTDDELNSFSFNGVGSGTTLEYLQSYYGQDDGFEWFGGAANIKYAISTASGDDSFDWTHGWSGYGQFLIAVQDPETSNNRGIEADNNSDNNTVAPISFPKLANVTLIGGGANAGGENEGIRFRVGTKGYLFNSIVSGFGQAGITVRDEATLSGISSGDLQVRNSYFVNNLGGDFSQGAEPFEAAEYKNATSGVDLNGFVGTGSSDFNVTSWNETFGTDFFEDAPFAGAASPDNEWWKGGWALDLDGNSY